MKPKLDATVVEDVLTMIYGNFILADTGGEGYTHFDAKQENLSLLYELIKFKVDKRSALFTELLKERIVQLKKYEEETNAGGDMIQNYSLNARMDELHSLLKTING